MSRVRGRDLVALNLTVLRINVLAVWRWLRGRSHHPVLARSRRRDSEPHKELGGETQPPDWTLHLASEDEDEEPFYERPQRPPGGWWN